jgi:ribonuclease P protein component
MPNGRGGARLGLIVASRVERRAVRRNYVKRLVREVFRGRQAELAGLDLVVQLRSSGGGRAAGRLLLEELKGLFAILVQWRASSSD